MENYSHELTESLGPYCDLTLRALPGRENGMPPSAFSQIRFVVSCIFFVLFSARRFDVLHAGDLLLWPVGFAGRIVSRRLRIVISAHGTDIAYPLRAGILPRIYRVYLALAAICSRRVGVIANSTATASLCRNAGFAVDGTIPLGVRVDSEQIDVPERGDFVLFVGRLIRRKGCAWFIRNVLPQLDEQVHLKVAGTKWDRHESAALTSDRVEFLGPIYGADLARLRREAIAVIVPNIACAGRDFEGFGLTATEAAADGGIVLASRLDGLEDAVIDGVTGHLLPPEDSQAWARRIEEIKDWSAEQRQSFIDRSRAAVAQHFDWERVASDTLAVYKGDTVQNRLRTCHPA